MKRDQTKNSQPLAFNGRGLIKDVVSKIGNVAATTLNRAIDFLPVELHIPGGILIVCGEFLDILCSKHNKVVVHSLL